MGKLIPSRIRENSSQNRRSIPHVLPQTSSSPAERAAATVNLKLLRAGAGEVLLKRTMYNEGVTDVAPALCTPSLTSMPPSPEWHEYYYDYTRGI